MKNIFVKMKNNIKAEEIIIILGLSALITIRLVIAFTS